MTVLLLCITVLGVGDSITAGPDVSYFDISTHQTTNIAADFLTTGAWLTPDSDFWADKGTFDIGHMLPNFSLTSSVRRILANFAAGRPN